jgi:hypothetical protein
VLAKPSSRPASAWLASMNMSIVAMVNRRMNISLGTPFAPDSDANGSRYTKNKHSFLESLHLARLVDRLTEAIGSSRRLATGLWLFRRLIA